MLADQMLQADVEIHVLRHPSWRVCCFPWAKILDYDSLRRYRSGSSEKHALQAREPIKDVTSQTSIASFGILGRQ
jgi:hypothetical protein